MLFHRSAPKRIMFYVWQRFQLQKHAVTIPELRQTKLIINDYFWVLGLFIKLKPQSFLLDIRSVKHDVRFSSTQLKSEKQIRKNLHIQQTSAIFHLFLFLSPLLKTKIWKNKTLWLPVFLYFLKVLNFIYHAAITRESSQKQSPGEPECLSEYLKSQRQATVWWTQTLWIHVQRHKMERTELPISSRPPAFFLLSACTSFFWL